MKIKRTQLFTTIAFILNVILSLFARFFIDPYYLKNYGAHQLIYTSVIRFILVILFSIIGLFFLYYKKNNKGYLYRNNLSFVIFLLMLTVDSIIESITYFLSYGENIPDILTISFLFVRILALIIFTIYFIVFRKMVHLPFLWNSIFASFGFGFYLFYNVSCIALFTNEYIHSITSTPLPNLIFWFIILFLALISDILCIIFVSSKLEHENVNY